MARYNTWLPGNNYFTFGSAVTSTLSNKEVTPGSQVLCQSFSVGNAQSGFGFTFDMVQPAFAITKPPKVSYVSTSAMVFILKDADGWLWSAPCPMHSRVLERGWEWDQFTLHSTQTEVGTPPSIPTPGVIQAFQFGGAEGVHDPDNEVVQTLSLAYVAGRTPTKTASGDIRKVVLTDQSPLAHTLKVGTVELVGGTRTPIKYLGALPFGMQLNGPRSNLAVLPYRGPIVAGYQSGTPWITLNNNSALAGQLDFMLEAQIQFQNRSPTDILGPWMHSYLQALWDCEQNGPIDTWVWDGPDGNPAWDGWQYRAFDGMSRTWFDAEKPNSTVSEENKTKLNTINTRFMDWLHDWLVANPDSMGVPNDWRPSGWTQGIPLPADSYLAPTFTGPSGHDIGLALKGTVFCALAGYDEEKAKYVIHRLIQAIKMVQYTPVDQTDEMHGAFTLDPTGFVVYGFEQGEILEALALCKQHPDLLVKAISAG